MMGYSGMSRSKRSVRYRTKRLIIINNILERGGWVAKRSGARQ
jgi:hypothetical protein